MNALRALQALGPASKAISEAVTQTKDAPPELATAIADLNAAYTGELLALAANLRAS